MSVCVCSRHGNFLGEYYFIYVTGNHNTVDELTDHYDYH